MERFDIATYLEGGLSGEELQAFEAELRSNPGFAQEVKLMRQLTQDMEMEGLRTEVTNILDTQEAAPDKDKKGGLWQGLLIGLALVCLVGYLFLPSSSDQPASLSTTPTEPSSTTSPSTTQEQDTPPVKEEDANPEGDSTDKHTPPEKKEAPPKRDFRWQRGLLVRHSLLRFTLRQMFGDKGRTIRPSRPFWIKFGIPNFLRLIRT